jgi:hypothetical protein
MLCDRELAIALGDVAYWHLATKFTLGPDVSFRGEAEVS